MLVRCGYAGSEHCAIFDHPLERTLAADTLRGADWQRAATVLDHFISVRRQHCPSVATQRVYREPTRPSIFDRMVPRW